MNNCFLPKIRDYDSEKDWDNYYEEIYEVFKNDFLDNNRKLFFNNLPVNIKKYPMVYNKEQAFYHITNKNESSDSLRTPDYRRCERIEWVRLFIENYFCNKLCDNCWGIHNWTQPDKRNTIRTYIWSKTKRFLVVLEKREKYYLLITAFHISESNIKKQIELENNYNNYKSTEIIK